jgi:uncharacterized membrane protein SpoIIM required for sporulation
MDAAPVIEALLDQGPLGLLALVLIGVIGMLWRQLQQERARGDRLEEARMADARASTEALVANTAVLREIKLLVERWPQ